MLTDRTFGARVQHESGRVLCALSGVLTYSSYDAFRPLFEAVKAHGTGDVVLDLGELHFVDSNGLGMLLVLGECIAATGRCLRLVNVQPKVGKVLARMGTQELLGAA